MQQQEIVLDSDAGDEVVYSGADSYPRATTIEVQTRGFLIAGDGGLRVAEGLLMPSGSSW